MADAKIQIQAGFVHISGTINEHFDSRTLDKLPRPIRLDLSKVTSVNSLGVRELVQLIARLGRKKLEYHRCAPAVVELLNMVPAVLGDPPDPHAVKSIIALYRCTSCNRDHPFAVEVISDRGELPELPDQTCPRCGVDLRPNQPARDLFGFFESE